jgi:hypothetical protein
MLDLKMYACVPLEANSSPLNHRFAVFLQQFLVHLLDLSIEGLGALNQVFEQAVELRQTPGLATAILAILNELSSDWSGAGGQRTPIRRADARGLMANSLRLGTKHQRVSKTSRR